MPGHLWLKFHFPLNTPLHKTLIPPNIPSISYEHRPGVVPPVGGVREREGDEVGGGLGVIGQNETLESVLAPAGYSGFIT